METILFIDSNTPIEAEVEATSPNTIKIITNSPINTSGFHLITDTGDIYGEYEDYVTLYKQLDDGFILSNDGTTYVEPEPVPTPEPYEPTLDELKVQKIVEMNLAQQKVIQDGIQSAEYGMFIPAEYQSEVLADFYSAQDHA